MAEKIKWNEEADYLVVGSGAAGATAALTLTDAGKSTLLIEEGGWYTREHFKEDVYSTMGTLFRNYGMQTARGRGLMMVLEGSCVGGSTVMNGAIVHRLPEKIYDAWSVDQGVLEAIPFSNIEACAEKIEQDLGITKNLEPILPHLPVTHSLTKMGWGFQSMNRNAPACKGTDRCLQGCPTGGKLSMENSYIPRAIRAGCRVKERHRVQSILIKTGRAIGVRCKTSSGEVKNYYSRRAVIVAAGAIQSPLLLKRSEIHHSHIGRHFQCHLGIGIMGILERPSTDIVGPPQGIEITSFAKDGMKLATQTMPLELFLARSPLVGDSLLTALEKWPNHSGWMGSIQSDSEGTVSKGLFGMPSIKFCPSESDLLKVREALVHLSRLLFEIGAKQVFPGITGPSGTPCELSSASQCDDLLKLPLDQKYYLLSAGHLFGTCRMGSNPHSSVVDPHFGVQGTKNLFVIDASIFPTNLGVNPQHSIMSLAMCATRGILERQ